MEHPGRHGPATLAEGALASETACATPTVRSILDFAMTHELGAGVLASERVYLIDGRHPTENGGRTFDLLGWELGDRRLRRRIAAMVERVGAATPIANAPDGEVRIEGAVEVIEPVRAPDGEAVAAYRAHAERRIPCPCHDRCRATLLIVRCSREVGRIAIRDASGLALLAEGPFVLRDAGGDALDTRAAGELIVRAGDRAAVLGRARRERDGIVLRGTRDAPVYVFAGESTGSIATRLAYYERGS